jgi:hypothetical protein
MVTHDQQLVGLMLIKTTKKTGMMKIAKAMTIRNELDLKLYQRQHFSNFAQPLTLTCSLQRFHEIARINIDPNGGVK